MLNITKKEKKGLRDGHVLQMAIGKQKMWWDKDIIEEVKAYYASMFKESATRKLIQRTFHAMLRSTADTAEDNLALKWPEDDNSEFD